MKVNLIKFVLLAIILPQPLIAATQIDISNDSGACSAGFNTMDVSVSVNNEVFKFEPDCDYGISESFTTKAGLDCKIKSDMCSAMFSDRLLNVNCDDGSSTQINIYCE